MSTRLKYQWILWSTLPRFAYWCLAIFISIVFFSDVWVGIVRAVEVDASKAEQIAQQPKATFTLNSAAAEQLFDEGMQLSEQGTAASLRQAIAKWEEALLLWRAVGDKEWEAITLNSIGGIYDALGEQQKALEYYNQSLPLFRAIGDKEWEAITLNSIGSVYDALGEQQKALEYYNQSLPFSRALGDKTWEALNLNGIGGIYDALGEQQKALEYYNQSLSLFRALGDKTQEATILSNIGLVYDALGEKQQALDYYNQALVLSRAVGNKIQEAATLTGIGLVYNALGEKQQALDYYNQALLLSRAVGDKIQEAATLTGIGGVYDALGEKQQALDYYNQALLLSRAVGDKTLEATALNNIGLVYDVLGEQQQALDYYNQALPLSRAVGDKTLEATALHNIGLVYDVLGEQQQALDYYNHALLLSRAVGDKAGVAITLSNIGDVYNFLGEQQQALKYYNQSLPLSRTVGDKQGEARTLGGIAWVKRDQGNLAEALAQIEAAVGIIESLRTKIASPKLRASYFATQQGYYEFYIDLLMQLNQQDPSQGYDAEALHASERSRARSLLELLTEANADIHQGVEPQLIEQERTLQQKLDTIEKHRIELFSSNYTPQQATAIEQEREQLLSQYRKIQDQIRATSPHYATLTQPQPLAIAEIQQQVLDDNSLLLQYSLGTERSYLWAVGKTGISSYSLPPREEIETAAKHFYELLKTPNFQLENTRGTIRVENVKATKAVNQLSQILLAPVAEQLGNKRLLIVSDGALQYIPFSALPLPETNGENVVPLLANNEIVNLPSATTLGIIRQEQATRKTAPKAITILADPVFSSDDERVTGSKQQPTRTLPQQLLDRSARETDIGVWQRLPGTRTEAEAIMALVPDSERVHGFDFAANREMITNPELSNYRIVHLATHGLLNSRNPELSGVVLSLFDEQGNSQLTVRSNQMRLAQ